MRIFLATCGSRGDVQPMIALSLALQSSGHEVMLAGPPEKKAWAKKLGCPYIGLGKDVTAFIDNMEDAVSFRAAIKFISFVRREMISQFETLPELINNADLIIASSLVLALSSIAEAKKIPYRYIAFTPQLYPSREHPLPVIRIQRLPKWCNKLSWDMAKIGGRFSLTLQVNHGREKIGLPPLKNAWEHILGENPIIAADEQIAKVPRDIKKKCTQTGYMHLALPPKNLTALDDFIATGSPPIFAGFGSMPKTDQAKNIPLLIAAAKIVKKRIVIAKFWEDASEFRNTEDVFFIKKYPHLKLFSRVAVVIHHGGAGTTAACAICGVPQIIVPHILDQFYHGHQVYLSRLGAKPIWRSRLTIGKLVSALTCCLDDKTIQETVKVRANSIDRGKNLALTVKNLTQPTI
jgi:UDP:flavonoid glycosyltransferase YjiC (YdhE family)